jgi:hypothetical protein
MGHKRWKPALNAFTITFRAAYREEITDQIRSTVYLADPTMLRNSLRRTRPSSSCLCEVVNATSIVTRNGGDW